MHESLILVPNTNQMYKEVKKIQTGNRVYCWSRKQTRKQRWISGFCRSIIFLGIKNVRVGRSIGNAHIFFWALSKKSLNPYFNSIPSDLIDFLCFNTTFNNISAISWLPVLVVEEAGVPRENHRPWSIPSDVW